MKFLRFSSMMLLFSVLGLTFNACTKDDLPRPDQELELRDRQVNTPASNTIVDIALSDPDNFSMLVDAVVRTGLVDVLSSEGPFTVFAPTNDAFTTFLDAAGFNSVDDVPVDLLTTVLTTHVLAGEAFAADLSPNYYKTFAGGPNFSKTDIFINTSGGVTVNGDVNVVIPDVDADNGVIHVVDQVIAPSTVLTLAIANPNFSSLVAALTRPDLSVDFVGVLSGSGPFTIVAPTNAAFQALLDSNPAWSDLNDIPADILESVLLYHGAADANLTSSFLLRGPTVETLLPGATWTTSVSGGGLVINAGSNDANVIAADVQAQNGVIHAIDAVILP